METSSMLNVVFFQMRHTSSSPDTATLYWRLEALTGSTRSLVCTLMQCCAVSRSRNRCLRLGRPSQPPPLGQYQIILIGDAHNVGEQLAHGRYTWRRNGGGRESNPRLRPLNRSTVH